MGLLLCTQHTEIVHLDSLGLQLGLDYPMNSLSMYTQARE